MKDIKKLALLAHEKSAGKLEIKSKVPLKTLGDLSTYYTPGVAAPCLEIAKNKELSYKYTSRGNMIAVITDGSAVLGLGNIGPEAAMPVMEGKCALFKAFGDVDAFPICLGTQDTEEIIKTVKYLAPSFGGINLEDISAPRCFEIEERLIRELDIPVFHDDQHGTAIVVLAGLINSLKITKKSADKVKIVVNGAGAAGTAIIKLLLEYGFKNFIAVDSKGIVYKGRENFEDNKKELSEITNKGCVKGGLKEATVGADIFIGVSKPNVLTKEMVKTMGRMPIIFAMSNPDPEINPKDANAAGAFIVATGRSDYPNQVNNVLAFPGVFKGALKAHAHRITTEMKIGAAKALAALVKNPNPKKVIPGVFDKGVGEAVAKAIISSRRSCK